MDDTKDRRALITGITGQDGSYLAEFLLAKGYEVHGIIRRASSFNTERIDHLYQDPHEDQTPPVAALRRPRGRHQPHPAADCRFSRTRSTTSPRRATCASASTCPEYTADVTGARHACACSRRSASPASRRASTRPRAQRDVRQGRKPAAERDDAVSPAQPVRGRARSIAYWTTVNYRESYGMFACNGILFNHESPRRGETFVTRKITRAVARIIAGLQEQALPRQPGRQARLGLRAGVRRGHVADAAAGAAGRLRHRHRRDPLRAGVRRDGVRASSASTGRRLRRGSTRATSARRRSTSSWATRPRPQGARLGARRPRSAAWCA